MEETSEEEGDNGLPLLRRKTRTEETKRKLLETETLVVKTNTPEPFLLSLIFLRDLDSSIWDFSTEEEVLLGGTGLQYGPKSFDCHRT